MKNFLWIVIVGFVLFGVVAACQPAQLAETPVPPVATVPPAIPSAASPQTAVPEVDLTVTGPQGSQTFSLDDLKKMPAVEGQAGIKSSTGKITAPATFKGVLLTDVLKQVGGGDSQMGVQLEASDGYAMTYSYDQITQGDFVTYDPATGDEIKDAGKLQVVLAYEEEGKPLDASQDGKLRLVAISEKPDQVIDGHWSIRFVSEITMKSLAEEWSLALQGAIDDTVDRGSYESCSTAKCHASSWTDNKAQAWTGTPLYLLAGRVDDEIKHDTGSYNAALADAGYTIEVVAKDGYSVTLDSQQIKGNKSILVANQVNGNALTDQDFPLKLVGDGLTNKQMVGGIAKIILHISPSSAATGTAPAPTSAPTQAATVQPTQGSAASSTAALTISGLVNQAQSWSLDDLKKMQVVKETVDVPKKGQQEVQGVNLNALLDLARLKADAKTLVFTASDAYSVEVNLQDIRDCPKALVAFADDGSLFTVLPDLASSSWARNLVKIEVK